MNISAYIMANRSQEVPIPTPGEEVEATITGGILYYPYHQTNKGYEGATTDNTYSLHLDEVTRTKSETEIPANFAPNGNDFCSLYPASGAGAVADCWGLPTRGSFTLSIGNTLPVGKYVFEVVHYMGNPNISYWSGTSVPSGGTEWDNIVSQKIIRSGTHGVIYAEINPEMQTYTGENSSSLYPFIGRVMETTVRYAFEVRAGDTTKTFAWGSGTDIDLADLWDAVHIFSIGMDGKNSHSMGTWANFVYLYKATVYKGA